MRGIRLSKYNRNLINKYKTEYPKLYSWYCQYKKESKIINNYWVYLTEEAMSEYLDLVNRYCNFSRYPRPYTTVSVTTVTGGTYAGYCNEAHEWFYNTCNGEQVKESAKVLFWRYDKAWSNIEVRKGNIITL